MRFLSNIFKKLWGIISGKEEIERLQSEVSRLYQRVQELQTYNLRLEMEIKKRDEQAARDKRWSTSDDKAKVDMLKSRFRDR